MSLYFYLLLIGGVAFFYSNGLKKQKTKLLAKDSHTSDGEDELNLVNLSSLKGESLKDKVLIRFNGVATQLGKKGLIQAAIGIAIVSFLMSYVVGVYLALGFVSGVAALTMTPVIASVILVKVLLNRRQKKFEESFPDAINLMTSAVSSGESVMQAIQFVGDKLDTIVGKEFKWVGQRLQIGESPDEVFRRSCQNCPYKSYRFFIITLRANMIRGGQLKEVMTRLNRVLFDARSVEKKTNAMTSEARLSAKIVGAIPFLFLFGMQYMSPENFQFVIHDPAGRMILYYLIGSEAIGMGIIWFLIRGIR
ncbi:type II secretion system F family protein [Vibrio sp. SCSIO 43136]|uniref:type II secretion system F family protein n=1 Tax=Vibrio sp. SCSIO 43136 TaxID=2819101 RepID=UPI00207524D3|nr:type II secretion system F family protein [Vibrio sp. SCSIO 43136]USD67760.1 type II secretion system F family protein [Vibrio sp. SCSIO 43136]